MVIKLTHTSEDLEKVIACLNMEVKSKPGEQMIILFLEFSRVDYAKKTFEIIDELPGIICALREKPGDFLLFFALSLQDYNIQIVNY